MSTALAALSRYPISGSLEARSSSGPAATTLGAIGTTSVAAGVVRRSQFRRRAAALLSARPSALPSARPTALPSSEPAGLGPAGSALPGSGQSAAVTPGAPPDGASVIDSDISSDAPPGVASASRDTGAVPLVLPTCCVMSHSGFAARLATHHQPRKIAIRDRYGRQVFRDVFLRPCVTVSPWEHPDDRFAAGAARATGRATRQPPGHLRHQEGHRAAGAARRDRTRAQPRAARGLA